MDKKKGLADMQDGEFILNESGTSVTTDNVQVDNNSIQSTPSIGLPEEDKEQGEAQ